METQCSANQLEFQGIGQRRIVVSNDAEVNSSDAGLVLLEQLERRHRIINRLGRCFEDGRHPAFVVHSLSTLLKQRIYGICQGYEDLNDHDLWRNDPLLSTICGNAIGVPTAGKSTLNRLELGNQVDEQYGDRYNKIRWNEKKIEELLITVFLDHYRRSPREIILDIDATDDPLHGQQEGRFFHGYYNEYCYLPLYVFCGQFVLTAKLRGADRGASHGSLEVLAGLVSKIRARFPRVRIIVRGDSGFCRDGLMRYCESIPGLFYVFGLSKNSRLLHALGKYRQEAKRRFAATGESQRVFADLRYRTRNSWSATRRVVGKAEHNVQGANPRFVVTNLPIAWWQAAALYEKLYCGRGDMENRIKEQQLYLFADRTSTGWISSNQLRLWFSSFAYLFFVLLREGILAETDCAKWQAHTLRLKLLKVSASVTVTVRRIRVRLPTAYPYWDLWGYAAGRFCSN
ncbi:MAG: IS1380 family transposase [Ktedonobacteraceae bacterium]